MQINAFAAESNLLAVTTLFANDHAAPRLRAPAFISLGFLRALGLFFLRLSNSAPRLFHLLDLLRPLSTVVEDGLPHVTSDTNRGQRRGIIVLGVAAIMYFVSGDYTESSVGDHAASVLSALLLSRQDVCGEGVYLSVVHCAQARRST